MDADKAYFVKLRKEWPTLTEYERAAFFAGFVESVRQQALAGDQGAVAFLTKIQADPEGTWRDRVSEDLGTPLKKMH